MSDAAALGACTTASRWSVPIGWSSSVRTSWCSASSPAHACARNAARAAGGRALGLVVQQLDSFLALRVHEVPITPPFRSAHTRSSVGIGSGLCRLAQ